MAMAEKDMTDLVAVTADDVAEGGIIEQPDPVHWFEVSWHRIVVHEQEKRPGMFGQPRLQPLLPHVAEIAGVSLRLHRVEKQAAAGGGVLQAMRETARAIIIWKDTQEGCTPIMIADAQPHRNRKPVEPCLEPFIVVAVAPVREIPGDDQQLGIVMTLEDVGQRPLEIEPGIAPADGLAGRGQMNI